MAAKRDKDEKLVSWKFIQIFLEVGTMMALFITMALVVSGYATKLPAGAQALSCRTARTIQQLADMKCSGEFFFVEKDEHLAVRFQQSATPSFEFSLIKSDLKQAVLAMSDGSQKTVKGGSVIEKDGVVFAHVMQTLPGGFFMFVPLTEDLSWSSNSSGRIIDTTNLIFHEGFESTLGTILNIEQGKCFSVPISADLRGADKLQSTQKGAAYFVNAEGAFQVGDVLWVYPVQHHNVAARAGLIVGVNPNQSVQVFWTYNHQPDDCEPG